MGSRRRALAAADAHLPAGRRRPAAGARRRTALSRRPALADLVLFYEYFHGDNGAGVGASHQTGWTGLVAKLLQQSGEYVDDGRSRIRALDSDACAESRSAARREWLETNGLGGFASSTIVGLNTRRYHGLLDRRHASRPSAACVLLSKLEETLVVGGRPLRSLAPIAIPAPSIPQGYRYLQEFRLRSLPRLRLSRSDGVELEKRVFMVHGENTTVVEYAAAPASACTLELRPLIAFRDYHATTHENGALNPDGRRSSPAWCAVRPMPDCPDLYLAHNARRRVGRPATGIAISSTTVERERGLDFQEDLFNPLLAHLRPGPRRRAAVIASTDRTPRRRHALRRARSSAARRSRPRLRRSLRAAHWPRAADQFIVAARRAARPSSPATTGSATGAATP